MIINEVLPLPHLPPLFFCSPSFGVTVKLAAPLLLILAENRSDWMNGIKFCSYLHWIKDKNVNKCIVAASNKCVSITYKYQAVTHSLWWAHMPPPPPPPRLLFSLLEHPKRLRTHTKNSLWEDFDVDYNCVQMRRVRGHRPTCCGPSMGQLHLSKVRINIWHFRVISET